ncbi:MAG: SRPBCC family protein [Gammaproteobacteria bacterium]
MKKFLSFIILLLIIIGVIGYFLPTTFTVSKTATISATPSTIHKYVGDLNTWQTWTAWSGDDPEIEITIGENTTGIGANQSWTDKHGGGSLIFTSWSPEKGIEYDLFFQGGKYKSKSAIQYDTSSQTRTRVQWTLDGDMGMPIIGGYLALLTKYSIGEMFQDGLNQLKLLAEAEK